MKLKKRKKRARRQSPADAANEFLQPIADWANGNYGAKKQLADAMTAETGTPVSRWLIERWLNPTPAKRDHPLLGNGLVLLRVWKKLKKRKDTKNTQ